MTTYAYTPPTTERSGTLMRSREVRQVTKKRQITIPKEMADYIGLGQIVEIELLGDEAIIIRPAGSDNLDFSIHILEDLVKEGVPQKDIVEAFRLKKLELAHTIGQLNDEVDMNIKNNPGAGHEFFRQLLED